MDTAPAARLEILKALGDNTRYAIYLELARSPHPLSTAAIAEGLGLHANTVRPHLERMREVGLLEVRPESSGSVGRPQNLYSLAQDAPALGLEPPAFPTLARMLLHGAAAAGVDGGELAGAGRDQGRADAMRHRRPTCVETLLSQLTEMGFDPATATDDDLTTVAFTRCPFQELANDHPDLVCELHRGMVEGLVELFDDTEVDRFHPLVDREPCRVDLVVAASETT